METVQYSSLRHVGDDLRELQRGDHTCLLYDSDEDLRDVMSTYVEEGLRRNQRVFYIAHPEAVHPILDQIRRAERVDVDRCIESGRFVIYSDRSAYLTNGAFDPDAMIRLIRKESEQADRDGYETVRVIGDMGWAVDETNEADQLLEYQVRLHECCHRHNATAICQYDTRRFAPTVILKVLQASATAIIGGEFCRNTYHMPPRELFSPEVERYRLRRWIQNIQGLNAERRFREETERELRQALHDKEQLLRELHHRVKNSLLMVSSLISLKEQSSPAAQDLTETKTFVQTIQLIYEKLHQADDMEHISFAPYARELLSDIVSLHAGPPVALDIQMPEVTLSTSLAVNLGLILNELTTNTLKHGFGTVANPVITVTLNRDDHSGEHVLTFSNNGSPLPKDFSLNEASAEESSSEGASTGGLGRRLISSFVEKINGSIEVQHAPHPVFTIRFCTTTLNIAYTCGKKAGHKE